MRYLKLIAHGATIRHSKDYELQYLRCSDPGPDGTMQCAVAQVQPATGEVALTPAARISADSLRLVQEMDPDDWADELGGYLEGTLEALDMLADGFDDPDGDEAEDSEPLPRLH